MENMEFLIEFVCDGDRCSAKCRLHAEFSQQMIAGPSHSYAPVQHCQHGKAIVPPGRPISLDIKNTDGAWEEFVRYG
jgi:hypothetical protein